MKRAYLYSILAPVLTIASVFALTAATGGAGYTSYSVFKAKAFNTTTNRTDTSAVLNTVGYPFVEFAMQVRGTDSAYIRTEIDAKIGNVWVLNVKRDTTARFGDATTTTGKAKGFVLVGPHTATPIPGTTQIRARVIIVPFAVADSTSAPSYDLTMAVRHN